MNNIYIKRLLKLVFVFAILTSFVKIPKNNIIANTNNNDKGEHRAVWVTPITGDVASYSSEESYKNEMNEVLDNMEYYNLNTIIYHVRTHNNALYDSNLNPKASYFSSVNFEVFDPLEWLIEETRSRGIEFHAWMNPYRVSSNYYAESLPSENPASDPSNLLTEGTATILNPGLPNVREFVSDTIVEFLNKYDVDGIHFDDYFYIDLGETGGNIINETQDESTFLEYRGDFPNTNEGKKDWRREQVNLMIELAYNTISDFNNQNNKFVQFGISPTGIYKNGNGNVTYDNNGNAITNGSNTVGQTHYSSYLFSDSLKWINEGWLDYITPQSYWATNHPTASYYEVMSWWNKVVKYKDVNLYSGIGLYMARPNTDSHNWINNENEMSLQLDYLKDLEDAKGFSIFTYRDVRNASNNKTGGDNVSKNLNNALNTNLNNIAPLPEINTMDKQEVNKVTNFNINNGILTWDSVSNAKSYYIYKSSNNITFSNDEIIGVIGANSELKFDTSDLDNEYVYGIKALSKTNHLSEGEILTDHLPTSTIDGASIRTETSETKQGLRFYAKLNDLNVSEHGFYLVYGNSNSEEVKNAVNDNNLIINDKKVFKVKVDDVDSNNMYSVVLTHIPEKGYVDNITAVSYAVKDGKTIISNTYTTRSILEVAFKMYENNDINNEVNNIINYVENNYKIINEIDENKYSFTSNFNELDPSNLLKEFLKDLNEFLGTNLTNIDASSFYNLAKEGIEESEGSNYNLSNSNIYKFFNNTKYQYKWSWLLDFLLSVDGTIHTTRQIEAIKSDGTNEDYILYSANHLSASISNFFNELHETLGFTAINFTNPNNYESLNEYNDKIKVDLSNQVFYKIGDLFDIESYIDTNKFDHYIVNDEIINDIEFNILEDDFILLIVLEDPYKFDTLEELKIAFLTDFHTYLNSSIDLNTFIHGEGKTSGFDGLWQDNLRSLYTAEVPNRGDNKNFITTEEYYDKWFMFMDFLNDLVIEINNTQTLWGSTWTGDIRIKNYFKPPHENFTEEMLERWPEGYQK